MDCIFCKITNKEIPAEIINESQNFLVFLDVNPVQYGHCLIIPKIHEPDLQNLPDEIYSELMLEAKRISQKIKNVYNPQKAGLMLQGFDVDHAHIHVIPLYNSDDIQTNHKVGKPSEKELNQIAQKLKS